MPLADLTIRNAKPGKKPIRLYDEKGLYLEIAPSGGKWWRLKYRFQGKEKRLSLGVYDDVSLAEAREACVAARKLIKNGVDPSANRKAQKATNTAQAANTFEVIAREWHAKFHPKPDDEYGKRILRAFERDIFPWIGGRPILEIEAPELLKALRRIEERGAIETAHRLRSKCGSVFRYAIATVRATRDPSADLKGAIPPAEGGHMAATTDPKRLAEILRAMDGYKGTLVVMSALRMAPLVFVRPGELRKARWAEIKLETGQWEFFIKKTKTDHIVPLCRQVLDILRVLKPLTGKSIYVFPGARSSVRPMSNNAVLAALRRMDIGTEEMCGHGFRAVARTILDEVLKVRPDYIEHQLGHAVRDPNGRAYNRTAFLPERHQMMQQWADYLDQLKAGDAVIPLPQHNVLGCCQATSETDPLAT